MTALPGIQSVVVTAAGGISDGRAGGSAVPWWSFTKTVLATAVLRLVQQGALSLDAPLPPAGWTLRQLLQHRAGLGDYGALPDYHAAVARHDPPWPVETLFDRVAAVRPSAPPGTGWAYSNIGYLILRQSLERTTALPLLAALEQLVLQPCGIVQVRLATTPADLAGLPGLAARYHPGWVYHGLLTGPLGAAALLLHRIVTGTLLSPGLLAEMLAGHGVGGALPDRPWAQPAYGLGTMCGTSKAGHSVIGHSGGGPDSVIAVYHIAKTGRTAAAFAAGNAIGAVETAALDAAAA